MPYLGRGRAPVVMTAIRKPGRRFDEFHWVDIVESGQLHCHIVPANLLDVATRERADAAVSTEQVVPGLRSKLVIAQLMLARQQPECVGPDDSVPVASFRANRTVTFVRSQAEIDIGLESNCAAVAASDIRFDHDGPRTVGHARVYNAGSYRADRQGDRPEGVDTP